jgi:hypothetical protein
VLRGEIRDVAEPGKRRQRLLASVGVFGGMG